MRRTDRRDGRNRAARTSTRRRWTSPIGADCDVELAVIAERRRSDVADAAWSAVAGS